jgi:hypothetical protein
MLQSSKPLTFSDKQMHYWSGVRTNPTGTGLPSTNTNNQSKATKKTNEYKICFTWTIMVKEIVFYERKKHNSDQEAVFQTSQHSTSKLRHSTAITLATSQQNTASLQRFILPMHFSSTTHTIDQCTEVMYNN